MRWYLVACCETRKAVLTFMLARIHDSSLLDETFIWPDDFSLESCWQSRAREWMTEVAERERSWRVPSTD